MGPSPVSTLTCVPEMDTVHRCGATASRRTGGEPQGPSPVPQRRDARDLRCGVGPGGPTRTDAPRDRDSAEEGSTRPEDGPAKGVRRAPGVGEPVRRPCHAPPRVGPGVASTRPESLRGFEHAEEGGGRRDRRRVTGIRREVSSNSNSSGCETLVFCWGMHHPEAVDK